MRNADSVIRTEDSVSTVSLAETADLTVVFWFEILNVAQAVGEAHSDALLSTSARYGPQQGSDQALHAFVTELRPVRGGV